MLTRIPGTRNFKGPSGKDVTLVVKALEGDTHPPVMNYAEQQLEIEDKDAGDDGRLPGATFTVIEGDNILHVLYHFPPGYILYEVVDSAAGKTKNELDRKDYDPREPDRAHHIIGVTGANPAKPG